MQNKINLVPLIEKLRSYILDDTDDGVECEMSVWQSDLDKIHENAVSLDDGGVLEFLNLVSTLRTILNESRASIGRLLSDPKMLDKYKEMYACINSPVVNEYRDSIVHGLARAVAMASKDGLLGDENDIGCEFDDALEDVLDGFSKLKYEVYKKSGRPMKNIKWFCPTVQVCGSLAECLICLEKSRDGIYVCFIAIPGTLDGWFGFFIKSDGNLFSYNDRIDEQYVGQHSHMRNGRYAEDKGFEIFPYDLCNFSNETDYRGYAKSMEFGGNADLLLNGSMYGSFIRTMIILLMLMRKFDGKVLEGEQVFVDSLLPNNVMRLNGTNDGTRALATIGDSQIVLSHRDFAIRTFDADKVISGEYDSEFDGSDGHSVGFFKGNNKDMVDAYGNGFSFDSDKVLASDSSLRLIGNGTCQQEFVATKHRMELRAYNEIRKQLADDIRRKMEKDYDEFGGLEGLRNWFFEKLRGMKDKLFDICADAYVRANGDGSVNFGEIERNMVTDFDGIEREKVTPVARIGVGKRTWHICALLNDVDEKGHAKCPVSRNPANVFFCFNFETYRQVREFLGCELPKFCAGWRKHREYNGNSILDVVDPVGELDSPFQNDFFFNFSIGFSKRALHKKCGGFIPRKTDKEDEA